MIKIGIRNALVITVIAVIGIVVLKVVTTKYPVKGVSELVATV